MEGQSFRGSGQMASFNSQQPARILNQKTDVPKDGN